jgi:hypothetical protein
MVIAMHYVVALGDSMLGDAEFMDADQGTLLDTPPMGERNAQGLTLILVAFV